MIPSAEEILKGDARALARAASLVETRSPAAQSLLKNLFARTGRAVVIGITGPPGAGKSTMTAALVRRIRSAGRRAAVVAVDPSSPFSGGAILGDRIRMLEHHNDPGVFIRSMATRGAMGGLAPATMDLTVLLDAAGFDFILVETVGVGQDEVDVARLATCTVVVQAPGMGDGVQAIKAGLLEIADVIAVNKADLPGAERLMDEMRSALDLAPADPSAWTPPVLAVCSTEERGVEELLETVAAFLRAGVPGRRAETQWRWRLAGMYRERLAHCVDPEELGEAARRVAARLTDPYTVLDGWFPPEGGGAPATRR